MPTWTDLLGAGLVLGTVITITFEKNIMEKCDIKKLFGSTKEDVKDEKEKEKK